MQCFSIWVLISSWVCWKLLSTSSATEPAVLPPDCPPFSRHPFHREPWKPFCVVLQTSGDPNSSGSSSHTRGLLQSRCSAFRNLSETASEKGLLQPGSELEMVGIASHQHGTTLAPPVPDSSCKSPVGVQFPSFTANKKYTLISL